MKRLQKQTIGWAIKQITANTQKIEIYRTQFYDESRKTIQTFESKQDPSKKIHGETRNYKEIIF